MGWKTEFERAAAREFQKLDHQSQRRIRDFFKNRVLPSEDPRTLGKALRGRQSKLWRYRIGPYRVIADIRATLIILLVRVGHRREIYR